MKIIYGFSMVQKSFVGINAIVNLIKKSYMEFYYDL